jgi:MtN3 and saliva related transmembrane protein
VRWLGVSVFVWRVRLLCRRQAVSGDRRETDKNYVESQPHKRRWISAGALTTTANLPQVWKTYRDKSAEGLSFRMLFVLSLGLALWMIYGFLTNLLPLILTNGIGTVLIVSLIVMKWKFDRSPTKD